MFHPPTLVVTSFALTLILLPVVAQAQVERVDLRVDGLACPFCAYGLEKKVSKLEGYEAESYKVRINEGMVSFSWRNDKPLDLDALGRAVDKAGFTLRGVTGRVVGTLEREKDQYLLRLLVPFDQRFVLQESSNPATGDARRGSAPASQTLGDRLKERLESMIADGNAVEIVGRVDGSRHADMLDSILVTDLKVREPPAESGGSLCWKSKTCDVAAVSHAWYRRSLRWMMCSTCRRTVWMTVWRYGRDRALRIRTLYKRSSSRSDFTCAAWRRITGIRLVGAADESSASIDPHHDLEPAACCLPE